MAPYGEYSSSNSCCLTGVGNIPLPLSSLVFIGVWTPVGLNLCGFLCSGGFVMGCDLSGGGWVEKSFSSSSCLLAASNCMVSYCFLPVSLTSASWWVNHSILLRYYAPNFCSLSSKKLLWSLRSLSRVLSAISISSKWYLGLNLNLFFPFPPILDL